MPEGVAANINVGAVNDKITIYAGLGNTLGLADVSTNATITENKARTAATITFSGTGKVVNVHGQITATFGNGVTEVLNPTDTSAPQIPGHIAQIIAQHLG